MPESRKRKLTPEQIIAGARRPEKTVKICLRADLSDQIRELEQRIGEVSEARAQDRRMGDPAVSPEEHALAVQVQALEEEADEFSVEFTVRGVPRDRWRSVAADCPPEGEWERLGYSVNMDEMASELLVESIVQPQIDPDSLTDMAANLNEGQWRLIRDAILNVNGGDGSLPFASRASLILRLSDSEDGSPEDTDSPSASSTGGNPARSRRASTTTTDA